MNSRTRDYRDLNTSLNYLKEIEENPTLTNRTEPNNYNIYSLLNNLESNVINNLSYLGIKDSSLYSKIKELCNIYIKIVCLMCQMITIV